MPRDLANMTEQELADLLNCSASALENVLGKGTQFALLVFDDPKTCQYISSCERTSMIQAMRETAARLSRGMDVPRTPIPRAEDGELVSLGELKRRLMNDDNLIGDCLAMFKRCHLDGDEPARVMRHVIGLFLLRVAGQLEP